MGKTLSTLACSSFWTRDLLHLGSPGAAIPRPGVPGSPGTGEARDHAKTELELPLCWNELSAHLLAAFPAESMQVRATCFLVIEGQEGPQTLSSKGAVCRGNEVCSGKCQAHPRLAFIPVNGQKIFGQSKRQILGALVTPIPREYRFQSRLQKNLSRLYFDLTGGYKAIISVKKSAINKCKNSSRWAQDLYI